MINIYDLSENQYYHIIPEFEINVPNYLKFELYIHDSYHITGDDIVISYYQQDSNFKKRKQLSRNNTVIWLTKEQIKKDFYISVESFYSETIFDLNIYPMEIIKLELDQQYIYYVTEENTKMEFHLCGDIEWGEERKSGMLSIWAIGNKDIVTELNKKNNYKHPNYNAYLIKINNLTLYKYNLTAKGAPGDLINVGHQFVYEHSNTTGIDFGIEKFGILKKNCIEKICFWVDSDSHNFYSYIYETNETNTINYEEEDDEGMGEKKYCLYLNDSIVNSEQFFYSVQAIKNEDRKN